MSFLRRLSLRRRSRNKRNESWPPTTNDEPSINVQQPDQVAPANTTHTTVVDVYEDRIEELGQLMAEQGRALDELTNRSRRLSTENSMLRDRLAVGVSAKPTVPPSSSSSQTARIPLKNIINSKSNKDDDSTRQLVQNLKSENSLLSEQSKLLANELADANAGIAERDASISSLGKELSTCLEKARSLMIEKRNWKTDMFQKTKDIESLEVNAKRSSTQLAEMSQRLELCLAERTALEAEATVLGSQMSSLAYKVDKQANEIVSKNEAVEKASDKVCKAEQASNSAKQEAKLNADNVFALQDNLRRTKMQQEQLELKLKATRDELEDAKLSQHKLSQHNDSLQGEVKSLVEAHKIEVNSWTKGQKKIVETLKDQHREEKQSLSKNFDTVKRANSMLENDISQCRRELQSCQQRCSGLEKLLTSRENENRSLLNDLVESKTEAETRLETSLVKEKELKASVSKLEDKLAALNSESKENTTRQNETIHGLHKQMATLKEKNHIISTQVSQLQEEIEKTRQACDKEKQKMKQQTEHTVKEIEVECEALRIANESKRLNVQENKDLLAKQSSLFESSINQLTAEKKDLTINMGNVIKDEKQISKSLMTKVQELNSKIQMLTQEKHQLSTVCNKNINQIYEYEKIIQAGEASMSCLTKQLSRSMKDQEMMITRQTELKKEASKSRLELERIKVRSK